MATGAFLFGFPIFTFKVLHRKQETLSKAETKARFDSLYQNVEVLKGPIAFAFTLYFCARRLAFAYVIGQVHWSIVY